MTAQEYLNQLKETEVKLRKLLIDNGLPLTTKLATPPQVGRMFEFYRPTPNFLPKKVYPKHNIYLLEGKPTAKELMVVEVF